MAPFPVVAGNVVGAPRGVPRGLPHDESAPWHGRRTGETGRRGRRAVLARSTPWVAPLGVALLALVLRLLHLAFTARLPFADDAVFFEEHARRFLDAWHAAETAQFLPLLRDAVDNASLQGVPYPLFQSLVYLAAGGVDHRALALVQALLGTATAWLTYLAGRRAFGELAGAAAGIIVAVYAPLVILAGLLLAEALLTFVQALALYLLARSLAPAPAGRWLRAASGACVGLLMLRPAFQYTGLLLLLALLAIGARRAGALGALRLAAPYLAGVLLVALPWLAVNGLVFGSFVWSRTGDAWQQVYWGIYPPNHGWWPPDSPVPPKYGVESLPGAWASGAQIQPKDLDYLEAAVQQVRATPLKAAATEVNKLYQAYLHPFNNYAEQPPLAGGADLPLHRGLAIAALAGLALAWLRPEAAILLGTAFAALSLPYLASHIDVRYTVPPAQVGALFAGHAVALAAGAAARWRERRGPIGTALLALAAFLVPAAVWAAGVPWLVALVPDVAPWHLHLARTAAMAAAFLTAAVVAGRLLGAATRIGQRVLAADRGGLEPSSRAGSRPFRGAAALPQWPIVASCAAAGLLLAALYVTQALYDGDWHEWSAVVPAGGAVRQTFVLPPGWRAPAGSRAEVRLYLAGSPTQDYVPLVRVNGQEVGSLGPGFTWVGPMRGVERYLETAALQGKQLAEVPRWYAEGFDVSLLAGGRAEVELDVLPADNPPDGVPPTGALAGTPAETSAGAHGAGSSGWARVWGDFAPRVGQRVYEGPAVFSRFPGADVAFHKFTATGQYGIWRWVPLDGPHVAPAWRAAPSHAWREADLSSAAGRQTGEYRIRLLILGPNGDLLQLY